jgi:hypothetical protein
VHCRIAIRDFPIVTKVDPRGVGIAEKGRMHKEEAHRVSGYREFRRHGVHAIRYCDIRNPDKGQGCGLVV